MSLFRSRRRTSADSSPVTQSTSSSEMALLESGTIVCDGVCYQADTLTWRNEMTGTGVASVLVTNFVPGGKASVMSE